jgi:hypothetical protein
LIQVNNKIYCYIIGSFIPEEGKLQIWELLTDYYIHHKPASRYVPKSKVLTQWWDKDVLKYLPYALLEITKTCTEIIQIQEYQKEMIDIYYDYYRYCINISIDNYNVFM